MMGRLSVRNGVEADDDAAVLLVQLKVFLAVVLGRFDANREWQEPGLNCKDSVGREKLLIACIWSNLC
jgi:hypothetical protein